MQSRYSLELCIGLQQQHTDAKKTKRRSFGVCGTDFFPAEKKYTYRSNLRVSLWGNCGTL